MIIYRPHREDLLESLEFKKEFKTEEEMKNFIIKEWEDAMSSLTNGEITNAPFTIEDIVIDDKIMRDERCHWFDTRYVCVKRIGKDVFEIPQCIGMCATNYEKEYIPFSS